MDDKKFTMDDAADLFGDDEPEEETNLNPEIESEPEPEPEPRPDPELEFKMKVLNSSGENEDLKSDDAIMDIRERALEMVGKCGRIFKLTLQGRLETEFPLADKRMVRKAVDSLKDHPKIKWPHGMLLEKV